MVTSSANKSAYLTNLLGAFVTTINDQLTLQLEGEVGAGGAAPAALTAVDTWPDCSIESLCGVLGLTHSGAVRLVGRLTSAGLVERRRGADARRVELRLTGQGQSVVRRVRRTRQRILDSVVSELSESERGVLATLLDHSLRQITPSGVQAQHSCRLCDHSVCPGDTCPIGSSTNVG